MSFLTPSVYGCDDRSGSVWAIRPLPGPSMSDLFEVSALLNEGSTTLLLAGVHGASRKPVAIKILRRAFLEQSTALERFRREARLALLLQSPNIPACIAQGVSDDGRPYFAIEHFEGKALDACALPISLELAGRIARGVSAALRVAHAHKTVHRDITPANILLAEDGSREEHIKLLDFGIASVTETHRPKLSQIGRFVGTPSHCAPEQFFGFGIDHKADIYGLASTLYEALTGRLPYVAPVHELVEAKVAGPPPRPSSIRRELNEHIDAWLLGPLHPNPAERPELGEWLQNAPE